MSKSNVLRVWLSVLLIVVGASRNSRAEQSIESWGHVFEMAFIDPTKNAQAECTSASSTGPLCERVTLVRGLFEGCAQKESSLGLEVKVCLGFQDALLGQDCAHRSGREKRTCECAEAYLKTSPLLRTNETASGFKEPCIQHLIKSHCVPAPNLTKSRRQAHGLETFAKDLSSHIDHVEKDTEKKKSNPKHRLEKNAEEDPVDEGNTEHSFGHEGHHHPHDSAHHQGHHDHHDGQHAHDSEHHSSHDGQDSKSHHSPSHHQAHDSTKEKSHQGHGSTKGHQTSEHSSKGHKGSPHSEKDARKSLPNSNFPHQGRDSAHSMMNDPHLNTEHKDGANAGPHAGAESSKGEHSPTDPTQPANATAGSTHTTGPSHEAASEGHTSYEPHSGGGSSHSSSASDASSHEGAVAHAESESSSRSHASDDPTGSSKPLSPSPLQSEKSAKINSQTSFAENKPYTLILASKGSLKCSSLKWKDDHQKLECIREMGATIEIDLSEVSSFSLGW